MSLNPREWLLLNRVDLFTVNVNTDPQLDTHMNLELMFETSALKIN